MPLPDGRVLCYADLGDPQGRPLVLHHGIPSSRLEAWGIHQRAARAGWRLLAPDRPGIGGSSPAPDRTIVDWPADLAALVEHLELGRVTALGYSGGAPYALAAAWARPDLVAGLAVVSGWGPPDRPGAYDGVTWLERASDGLARRVPWASRGGFELLAGAMRLWPSSVAAVLGGRLPDSLAEEEPDLRPGASLGAAVAQGGRGPADDLRLVVRPWGFPLGAVPVPAAIWHGTRDEEIPFHHGEFLARVIVGSRLVLIPGEGHLLLFSRADQILRELAELADLAELAAEG